MHYPQPKLVKQFSPIKIIGDVDTTSLEDGAILQYRSSDAKFVARNEIVTTTGTLTKRRSILGVLNGYSNSDKRSSGTTLRVR